MIPEVFKAAADAQCPRWVELYGERFYRATWLLHQLSHHQAALKRVGLPSSLDDDGQGGVLRAKDGSAMSVMDMVEISGLPDADAVADALQVLQELGLMWQERTRDA